MQNASKQIVQMETSEALAGTREITVDNLDMHPDLERSLHHNLHEGVTGGVESRGVFKGLDFTP